LLPILDGGLTTLFRDLAERGLLDSTLVVVTGEFGRTRASTRTPAATTGPGLHGRPGAGGGIKGGRAIGKSNETRRTAASRSLLVQRICRRPCIT